MSTPGFRTPLGSTASFAPRSASANRIRSLAVVPGPVVTPDGVVMGDRPARVDHRLRDGCLDLVPLLDLAAAVGRAQDREVGSRPVRIDVGEATRQPRRPRTVGRCAAGVGDRPPGGLHHFAVEGLEPIPGDRGFERVAQHSAGDERVPQVRGGEEGVAPCSHRVLPVGLWRRVGPQRAGPRPVALSAPPASRAPPPARRRGPGPPRARHPSGRRPDGAPIRSRGPAGPYRAGPRA